MLSRKFLSTILLAVLSCGFSFQSKAADLTNGSFEQGNFDSTALYPNLAGLTDWTAVRSAYQVGNSANEVVTGYGFWNGLGFVNVSGPTNGNGQFFAAVSTFDLLNGFYQPSSITTTNAFTVNGPTHVLFDMFLYSDSVSHSSDAIASAYVSMETLNGWIPVYSKSFSLINNSGVDQIPLGFITGDKTGVDPWISESFVIEQTGTYKLTFAIQQINANSDQSASVFGVDNVRVVPVPAAAWTGLALLGLFPLRRKLMGR